MIMNTNTSPGEVTVEVNTGSPVNKRRYRRIVQVTEDSDDSDLGNEENLPIPRCRNRKGNYVKMSTDKKEILIKCYEEGKPIAESAELAGINKNTATSIIRRYKKDGCEIFRRNRGGKRNVKLSDEILLYVEKLIEESP